MEKDRDTLIRELTGVILKNPISEEWETADAYLSGNVRNKLESSRKLLRRMNPCMRSIWKHSNGYSRENWMPVRSKYGLELHGLNRDLSRSL